MSLFTLAFPKEEQKLYTRISFYEYKRVSPRFAEAELRQRGNIRLPLPSSLPDNYSMALNTVDMGDVDAILGLIPSGSGIIEAVMNFDVIDAISKVSSTVSKIFSPQPNRGWRDTLGDVTSGAAVAASLLPGGTDLVNYVRAYTGTVRNPNTTTIFNNVNLRQHNFTFKLSPRNQDDARALRDIIEQIKVEMHPKTSVRGFGLEFPSVAKMEFVGNNILATDVYYSFISSFNPVYSATGKPSFYKDGTPVAVELQLSFQELNILTREDFRSLIQEPVTTNDGRLAGPV